MTVIVAGTIRVPPQNLDQLRPHMAEMIAASRAEDGCVVYSYAEDVLEPGLIRIFEAWRDGACLDAHRTAPHMAPWRAAGAALGVSERRLVAYEVAAETPL